MSNVVKAKCPKCKNQISVEEVQSVQPVTCSSCQSKFVPAAVIAESNKRFEMAMYGGMIVVAIGLIAYMAITNRMKPKPEVPEAPAAVEVGDGNQ
jgi:DNA-directed RNA polymerase subunit RPC12/RpoP